MTVLAVTGDGWAATLLPEDGGGLAALRFRGRDVLVPAPDGARLGGPFGAFWMIPWANRMDGGRIGPHRVPVNRPEDDTAIHGLSRDLPWQVESAGPGWAVLVQHVAAGPYRYAARLSVGAGPSGFGMALEVANAGVTAMPFGIGWHPWFPRTEGVWLAFRAARRLAHDPRGLPLAAEACDGIAGGEQTLLCLDTHFTGWDGLARIAWPGLDLAMTATGALAAGLQVYAPPGPAVLCVEPSSHLPDAPNRPAALAGLGPMRVLGTGEILTGRIDLVAKCSHLPAGEA